MTSDQTKSVLHPPPINWHDIDAVLLDMDGTLLDLHFDNYFWLHYLPGKYAQLHGIHFEESKSELFTRYASQSGKLNWYCLDFWEKELQLDIIGLKKNISHLIAYRPMTQTFLNKLKCLGKKRILITNAHPHSLQLKLDRTQLNQFLDSIHSSHQFNLPKEDQLFWPRFLKKEAIDISRTLLIDDSVAVLDNARNYGFQHLLTIKQPDSQRKTDLDSNYYAIDCFSHLF